MFLLIVRLGQEAKHLLTTQSITFFTAIWAVVSLFVMAFQCSLPEPWNTQNHSRCSSLVCFDFSTSLPLLTIAVHTMGSCRNVQHVYRSFSMRPVDGTGMESIHGVQDKDHGCVRLFSPTPRHHPDYVSTTFRPSIDKCNRRHIRPYKHRHCYSSSDALLHHGSYISMLSPIPPSV